jgi:hypothetical protein
VTLMLRGARENIFTKQRVGVVPKLDPWAFQYAPRRLQFFAQCQMAAQVTRETAEVVNGDSAPCLAIIDWVKFA